MLSEKIKKGFLDILSEELIPAMGCTEPIALAYAAAKGKLILGNEPDKIIAKCSGNIIKNSIVGRDCVLAGSYIENSKIGDGIALTPSQKLINEEV